MKRKELKERQSQMPSEAAELLVQMIVSQAHKEGVPISDVERKMLPR